MTIARALHVAFARSVRCFVPTPIVVVGPEHPMNEPTSLCCDLGTFHQQAAEETLLTTKSAAIFGWSKRVCVCVCVYSLVEYKGRKEGLSYDRDCTLVVDVGC